MLMFILLINDVTTSLKHHMYENMFVFMFIPVSSVKGEDSSIKQQLFINARLKLFTNI